MKIDEEVINEIEKCDSFEIYNSIQVIVVKEQQPVYLHTKKFIEKEKLDKVLKQFRKNEKEELLKQLKKIKVKRGKK